MKSRLNHSEPGIPQRLSAFTLVELVIIAALLGLLTAIIPAVAGTRSTSIAVRCLNNLRQLGVAWRMYADDNAGRLVWNRDGGSAGLTSQSWVGGWLDFSNGTDNTNTAPLVDHAKYPFAAYLGAYIHSALVFKCPADSSKTPRGLARVRSVSMNNCVGEGSRPWQTTQYQLYRKIDAIGKPTPAQLWIILDEHEDSINDGCFFTNPDFAYNLIDFPASYHNRAAGFAFADGHSEIHHWIDPRTTPILAPGQILQLNVTLPNDLDVTWLQQHATSKP